jgi:hypothetical protein
MSHWERFWFEWRLRRLLKRKSSIGRAYARLSGLKEWSDHEVIRLKPSWTRRFTRQQRFLARVLETLALATLVVASTFFAMSIERFWVWEASAQTALHEVKQVITKEQAWNMVKKPRAVVRTGESVIPEPLLSLAKPAETPKVRTE